jgi:hypothetical protein
MNVTIEIILKLILKNRVLEIEKQVNVAKEREAYFEYLRNRFVMQHK